MRKYMIFDAEAQIDASLKLKNNELDKEIKRYLYTTLL